LKDLPNIEIVGEAADGREALRMTEELHPDVVLMDISMAGMNGLEATSRISKEFAATKVIILSMHANEEYVLRALRAGASGYLPKDAAASELEIAIHAVARGETYLSPAVSKHVVGDYLRRVADERSPLEQLTPRQRETLQLIAEGQTTKEIAQTLQVSVKTVETHRAQLMERLDIHDIAGLVRYAMQMGLVRSER
jgi:DNA-binding NarL/FixJ family response regulator